MNRSGAIDSNNALDIAQARATFNSMQHVDERTDYTLQMLVLERRDEGCNMARYYVLSVEPTLFGDIALVRQWGRIGFPGRRRLDLHRNDEAAGEALETWLARKVSRGYQIRV
jgi:predicted DNA-binding WGR domain protein